jgi:hypothetical protein
VRRPLARYRRYTFDAVVVYEFLLPLKQEVKLRAALDELFYADTVEDLVRDLDDDGRLSAVLKRRPNETAEQHIRRAAQMVASRFEGYSVSHVSGRFRSATVATRKEAAHQLLQYSEYLVDETTAVVRFIFPCEQSKRPHDASFDLDWRFDPGTAQNEALEQEILTIRKAFFAVFVDAVVKIVEGEDVIWLMEESPLGRRLYALEKSE